MGQAANYHDIPICIKGYTLFFSFKHYAELDLQTTIRQVRNQVRHRRILLDIDKLRTIMLLAALRPTRIL
jgi:hypothetical protein